MRSCTLTEVKPVPIGVVTGPLRPTPLRTIESSTSCGSGLPCFSSASCAGEVGFPFELRAGRRDHAQGRRADLGADAVAGEQCDGFHEASRRHSIEGAGGRLHPRRAE